jgi:hypothetical protein
MMCWTEIQQNTEQDFLGWLWYTQHFISVVSLKDASNGIYFRDWTFELLLNRIQNTPKWKEHKRNKDVSTIWKPGWVAFMDVWSSHFSWLDFKNTALYFASSVTNVWMSYWKQDSFQSFCVWFQSFWLRTFPLTWSLSLSLSLCLATRYTTLI